MSKKFPISKENNILVKLMLPTVPILYIEANQGGLCSYAIATVFQKFLGEIWSLPAFMLLLVQLWAAGCAQSTAQVAAVLGCSEALSAQSTVGSHQDGLCPESAKGQTELCVISMFLAC